MFIDKDYFDSWMKRIMARFDDIEEYFDKPQDKERQTLNGEILFDNQDLCMMLNISKRSVQRFRSYGWLEFKRINQKTYYLKSDVEKFIREHFNKMGKNKNKINNKTYKENFKKI